MTQILPAYAADVLPLGFALSSMGTGVANQVPMRAGRHAVVGH
jgi:hypothetical protein